MRKTIFISLKNDNLKLFSGIIISPFQPPKRDRPARSFYLLKFQKTSNFQSAFILIFFTRRNEYLRRIGHPFRQHPPQTGSTKKEAADSNLFQIFFYLTITSN